MRHTLSDPPRVASCQAATARRGSSAGAGVGPCPFEPSRTNGAQGAGRCGACARVQNGGLQQVGPRH
eukprot:4512514-Alexandrium_andersonii.AAC.1